LGRLVRWLVIPAAAGLGLILIYVGLIAVYNVVVPVKPPDFMKDWKRTLKDELKLGVMIIFKQG
jgi:hypothetical protein